MAFKKLINRYHHKRKGKIELIRSFLRKSCFYDRQLVSEQLESQKKMNIDLAKFCNKLMIVDAEKDKLLFAKEGEIRIRDEEIALLRHENTLIKEKLSEINEFIIGLELTNQNQPLYAAQNSINSNQITPKRMTIQEKYETIMKERLKQRKELSPSRRMSLIKEYSERTSSIHLYSPRPSSSQANLNLNTSQNHSINHSTNQSINHSMNHSINQNKSQSINHSKSQSINHSKSQSKSRSTIQSRNQSMNASQYELTEIFEELEEQKMSTPSIYDFETESEIITDSSVVDSSVNSSLTIINEDALENQDINSNGNVNESIFENSNQELHQSVSSSVVNALENLEINSSNSSENQKEKSDGDNVEIRFMKSVENITKRNREKQDHNESLLNGQLNDDGNDFLKRTSNISYNEFVSRRGFCFGQENQVASTPIGLKPQHFRYSTFPFEQSYVNVPTPRLVEVLQRNSMVNFANTESVRRKSRNSEQFENLLQPNNDEAASKFKVKKKGRKPKNSFSTIRGDESGLSQSSMASFRPNCSYGLRTRAPVNYRE